MFIHVLVKQTGTITHRERKNKTKEEFMLKCIKSPKFVNKHTFVLNW